MAGMLAEFDVVVAGIKNVVNAAPKELRHNSELLYMIEQIATEDGGPVRRLRWFGILAGVTESPQHQTFLRCEPWCREEDEPVILDYVEHLPLPTLLRCSCRTCLFSEDYLLDMISSDTLAKEVAQTGYETTMFQLHYELASEAHYSIINGFGLERLLWRKGMAKPLPNPSQPRTGLEGIPLGEPGLPTRRRAASRGHNQRGRGRVSADGHGRGRSRSRPVLAITNGNADADPPTGDGSEELARQFVDFIVGEAEDDDLRAAVQENIDEFAEMFAAGLEGAPGDDAHPLGAIVVPLAEEEGLATHMVEQIEPRMIEQLAEIDGSSDVVEPEAGASAASRSSAPDAASGGPPPPPPQAPPPPPPALDNPFPDLRWATPADGGLVSLGGTAIGKLSSWSRGIAVVCYHHRCRIVVSPKCTLEDCALWLARGEAPRDFATGAEVAEMEKKHKLAARPRPRR